jgi:non-specific serine/threonine protein kinase
LFPFILRRTKEQVAKDLPDKTEMILFCEMGEEQRKIYDAYRND